MEFLVELQRHVIHIFVLFVLFMVMVLKEVDMVINF